eukprot:TRINITY_DN13661_c0_g2_i1.p1 TRINITY_DN13661_c0_g2~~TRINITY_DN13661_c0_g2_i1.p1  ORF type:complete len:1329 (+),score=340.42 TRINITY_DN13661_c0_g2_i1:163-3987(+)
MKDLYRSDSSGQQDGKAAAKVQKEERQVADTQYAAARRSGAQSSTPDAMREATPPGEQLESVLELERHLEKHRNASTAIYRNTVRPLTEPSAGGSPEQDAQPVLDPDGSEALTFAALKELYEADQRELKQLQGLLGRMREDLISLQRRDRMQRAQMKIHQGKHGTALVTAQRERDEARQEVAALRKQLFLARDDVIRELKMAQMKNLKELTDPDWMRRARAQLGEPPDVSICCPRCYQKYWQGDKSDEEAIQKMMRRREHLAELVHLLTIDAGNLRTQVSGPIATPRGGGHGFGGVPRLVAPSSGGGIDAQHPVLVGLRDTVKQLRTQQQRAKEQVMDLCGNLLAAFRQLPLYLEEWCDAICGGVYFGNPQKVTAATAEFIGGFDHFCSISRTAKETHDLSAAQRSPERGAEMLRARLAQIGKACNLMGTRIDTARAVLTEAGGQTLGAAGKYIRRIRDALDLGPACGPNTFERLTDAPVWEANRRHQGPTGWALSWGDDSGEPCVLTLSVASCVSAEALRQHVADITGMGEVACTVDDQRFRTDIVGTESALHKSMLALRREVEPDSLIQDVIFVSLRPVEAPKPGQYRHLKRSPESVRDPDPETPTDGGDDIGIPRALLTPPNVAKAPGGKRGARGRRGEPTSPTGAPPLALDAASDGSAQTRKQAAGAAADRRAGPQGSPTPVSPAGAQQPAEWQASPTDRSQHQQRQQPGAGPLPPHQHAGQQSPRDQQHQYQQHQYPQHQQHQQYQRYAADQSPHGSQPGSSPRGGGTHAPGPPPVPLQPAPAVSAGQQYRGHRDDCSSEQHPYQAQPRRPKLVDKGLQTPKFLMNKATGGGPGVPRKTVLRMKVFSSFHPLRKSPADYARKSIYGEAESLGEYECTPLDYGLAPPSRLGTQIHEQGSAYTADLTPSVECYEHEEEDAPAEGDGDGQQPGLGGTASWRRWRRDSMEAYLAQQPGWEWRVSWDNALSSWRKEHPEPLSEMSVAARQEYRRMLHAKREAEAMHRRTQPWMYPDVAKPAIEALAGELESTLRLLVKARREVPLSPQCANAAERRARAYALLELLGRPAPVAAPPRGLVDREAQTDGSVFSSDDGLIYGRHLLAQELRRQMEQLEQQQKWREWKQREYRRRASERGIPQPEWPRKLVPQPPPPPPHVPAPAPPPAPPPPPVPAAPQGELPALVRAPQPHRPPPRPPPSDVMRRDPVDPRRPYVAPADSSSEAASAVAERKRPVNPQKRHRELPAGAPSRRKESLRLDPLPGVRAHAVETSPRS